MRGPAPPGEMGIRSDEVYQPSLQKGVAKPFDPTTEVAHKAAGRDLAKHPSLNKPDQKLDPLLDRLDALRVGEHRRDALHLYLGTSSK